MPATLPFSANANAPKRRAAEKAAVLAAVEAAATAAIGTGPRRRARFPSPPAHRGASPAHAQVFEQPSRSTSEVASPIEAGGLSPGKRRAALQRSMSFVSKEK